MFSMTASALSAVHPYFILLVCCAHENAMKGNTTCASLALTITVDFVRCQTSIYFAYNAYSFFASQGLISMLIYNFSFACRALKAIIDWTIMWAESVIRGVAWSYHRSREKGWSMDRMARYIGMSRILSFSPL
jgi:hypothetical protein